MYQFSLNCVGMTSLSIFEIIAELVLNNNHSLTQYCLIDWLIDCCLMSSEQFFNYEGMSWSDDYIMTSEFMKFGMLQNLSISLKTKKKLFCLKKIEYECLMPTSAILFHFYLAVSITGVRNLSSEDLPRVIEVILSPEDLPSVIDTSHYRKSY